MLTLTDLKEMEKGTIFATGEIENSPEGLYMINKYQGKKLLWIAKRGGIEDWAIYTHWAENGMQFVIENGDKVKGEWNIKKLVPCDQEAFERYRY